MKKKSLLASLCAPIFIQCLIGLVMIYSASSVIARATYDDPLYFLKRQSLFLLIGLICLYITSHIPYQLYQKYAKLLLVTSLVLLVLVLIPGIGLVRGGARSWIGLSSFNIQPAEIVKVTMVIYLSSLTDAKSKVTDSKRGYMHRLPVLALAVFLVMLQPDLGTVLIIVTAAAATIFFQGAKIKHFVMLFICGLFGLAALIMAAPYRMKRIVSFLDPWQDPLGSGFQAIQSLLAIGPGGILGVGLFQGKQKYFYLPEPHNDFIFAVIAEELGLIGSVFVISMFFIFLYRGTKLSLLTYSKFGRSLCLGLMIMIVSQACVNLAVTVGLIPVTGITLPFLSYGGSSLVINLWAIGILLNIEKQV